MNGEQEIYSKQSIEFATVAVETCLFLEKTSDESKTGFVNKAIKLLPLLYLKTVQLDLPENDEVEVDIERFVTEDDYLFVKNKVEALLGEDDSFLEVFHPDMPYSDAPIAAFVSENLADIYQELKDFAANFQIGVDDIMLSALYAVVDGFMEHWGQKLLNVLRALHAFRFGERYGADEENDDLSPTDYRKLDRNSFLNFQNEE